MSGPHAGGDTGFGHALCKYLDELGFTVFAGVLDERGPGAEDLRRTCSTRLCVLQLDITIPEQIKDAHSKVVAKVQQRGTALPLPPPWPLPPNPRATPPALTSLGAPAPVNSAH